MFVYPQVDKRIEGFGEQSQHYDPDTPCRSNISPRFAIVDISPDEDTVCRETAKIPRNPAKGALAEPLSENLVGIDYSPNFKRMALCIPMFQKQVDANPTHWKLQNNSCPVRGELFSVVRKCSSKSVKQS